VRPVDIARQITTRRRSARTELHWVPRVSDDHAGSHQQYAAADRSVGERDWAAIDPIQVRTSKGVRHYFTGALYYWQRSRRHVWCESQEERWEVLWLDSSSGKWIRRCRLICCGLHRCDSFSAITARSSGWRSTRR